MQEEQQQEKGNSAPLKKALLVKGEGICSPIPDVSPIFEVKIPFFLTS